MTTENEVLPERKFTIRVIPVKGAQLSFLQPNPEIDLPIVSTFNFLFIYLTFKVKKLTI